MTVEVPNPLLEGRTAVLAGRNAFVVGIANEHSIATATRECLDELGPDLAITYLNEKPRGHVEPLAEKFKARILAPLNVWKPASATPSSSGSAGVGAPRHPRPLHRVGPEGGSAGGPAPAPLHNGGFAKTMDISCFIRMTRRAVPLRTDGGTLFAMSHHNAQQVVPSHNVMGPVKAALEAACRYLAYDLGTQCIRVHTISPGPLRTRAASGSSCCSTWWRSGHPLGELLDVSDVGFACAYLVTPYMRRITGATVYVDGGVNIMA